MKIGAKGDYDLLYLLSQFASWHDYQALRGADVRINLLEYTDDERNSLASSGSSSSDDIVSLNDGYDRLLLKSKGVFKPHRIKQSIQMSMRIS